MELDKRALDRYITTEPDNGYNSWCERVWDLIPEESISGDEYDKYEQFFDDGLYELSLAGSSNFINPQFAANVLQRRFRRLKEYPECKTWEELKSFIMTKNL